MKAALRQLNTPHVIIVCVMTAMLLTVTIPISTTSGTLFAIKGEVTDGGRTR